MACLGMVLIAATEARAQSSPVQNQIKLHEQMLAQKRAAHQMHEEGLELITLGYLYRQAGQMQTALEDLNEALRIEQSVDSQPGVAMTQNTIGRVYSDLGQQQKALSRFNEAVAIWRKLRIRQAEANTLSNIGRAYNDLGQRDVAQA
jgi:tetratricopeptide (TPR) repeat protein